MILLRRTRHLASIVTLVLVCGAGALAQSQPPTPSGGRQSTQQQQTGTNVEPQASVDQAAPQPVPPTANLPSSPLNQITIQQTNDQQKESALKDLAPWILGLLAIGVGVLQWWVMKGQRDISEKQGRILDETLATNKIVERAYVKVSHEWIDRDAPSPIEFVLNPDPQQPQGIRANITVKNEGRTPADVLGGFIWAHVGAITEGPQRIPQPFHQPFRVEPVFLTGGGTDFVRTDTVVRLQRLFRGGGDQLWLVGYVDYRDRFGEYHRTGYCRHLAQSGDLVFDQTTSSLNYDESLSVEHRRQYPNQGDSAQ